MKNKLNIVILLAITISSYSQNSNELKVGDIVSDFSSLDDNGAIWNSATVEADFLVVYFYPAAMTGGCTKQACAYRDDKTVFDKMSAAVIGVSGDEVSNLKHFKTSYQLNFPLLSDTEGTISKNFGVPTGEGGSITREIEGENYLLVRAVTTPRWTFVLDKERKIIYKNMQVNAEEDSNKVKEVIQNYKKI